MAGRSLNKVELIGNVTRDPEMKYTPGGKAVVTFSLATNRSWRTETGENKEEVEYHRLVAWDKLAETIGQYTKKGSKLHVEGRLQTRKWTGQDGVEKYTTEIIVSTMIMLDSKRDESAGIDIPDNFGEPEAQSSEAPKASKKAKSEDAEIPEIDDSDIPF